MCIPSVETDDRREIVMILGTLISTGENMLSAFVTGRLFPAAAAGAADVTDNSLPSDVQESVQEVTS